VTAPVGWGMELSGSSDCGASLIIWCSFYIIGNIIHQTRFFLPIHQLSKTIDLANSLLKIQLGLILFICNNIDPGLSLEPIKPSESGAFPPK
jgi:hypothetical protein